MPFLCDLRFSPFVRTAHIGMTYPFHKDGCTRSQLPTSFNGLALSGHNITGPLGIGAANSVIPFILSSFNTNPFVALFITFLDVAMIRSVAR